MNKQIRELAEQAGYMRERWNTTEAFEGFLEKFAALVAEHERGACAQLVVDLDGGLEWVAKEIRSRK